MPKSICKVLHLWSIGTTWPDAFPDTKQLHINLGIRIR